MHPKSTAPAILFDLDGTLIDTVYEHVLAWSAALRRANICHSELRNPSPHRDERWIPGSAIGSRADKKTSRTSA